MGLVASQGRLEMLTRYKSQVEFTGQSINQKRLELANKSSLLQEKTAQKVDPGTNQTGQVTKEIEALHQQDKMLEMQLKRVDTQQQAVSTEIGAVQKVIDKNIEMSFKTFG